MNVLRNKTNNLRSCNTSALLLDFQYLLQEFQFCTAVHVKIVLSPDRLSLGTRISHPMESVKILQAQHRSSQKKTWGTGLHANFLPFRNPGAVESHTFITFFYQGFPYGLSLLQQDCIWRRQNK